MGAETPSIHTVTTDDGAALHVESRGSGPPLLLIAGGTGSAAAYAPLASALADRFTVITYDRRGHFGSSAPTRSVVPMHRHADDAHLVLQRVAGGSGLVFGSSAGGVIAIELFVRYPAAVLGLVVHEPPVLQLMPAEQGAQRWLTIAESCLEAAESGRYALALRRLIELVVPAGQAIPEPHLTPDAEREWARLFDCEWRSIFQYLPVFERLQGTATRVVMASGEESRGSAVSTVTGSLAERLSCEHVTMPGAHLAPVTVPVPFAAALVQLLA